MGSEEQQRIRFTYEKGDRIKFISHQDEFRLWERTLRRANLPLLYKQGFNPQPHMQFAAPLGLGMTGIRELVDVIFSPPLPLGELRTRVADKLPPGVTLHDLEEVPVKTKALQALTVGADYTILIHAEPDEIPETLLRERIDAFLALDEVWRQRERHGQPFRYNLRPLVFELRYEGYDEASEEHRILLRVQMRPGATGRPDEVVTALGFDNFARTLRRDWIYFEGTEEADLIFGQYPVVTQDEVEPDRPPKRRRRRQRRGKQEQPKEKEEGAQSFADKASDEFV